MISFIPKLKESYTITIRIAFLPANITYTICWYINEYFINYIHIVKEYYTDLRFDRLFKTLFIPILALFYAYRDVKNTYIKSKRSDISIYEDIRLNKL